MQLTQATNATTPILVPRASGPAPSTQYFVVIGHPSGDYIPESSLSELNRDCTVSDIAGGQHDNVRRVIAVDLATGRCWDASKEIAKDVLAQVLDTYDVEDIPSDIMDFLEDILGYGFVQSCLVEAAAFSDGGNHAPAV